MKKVILFITNNIGGLHALNDKVTAAYKLWSTIYQALLPLIPGKPTAAPVVFADEAPAPVAPAPVAWPVAPAPAPDARENELNDTDYMRLSGLIS